MGEIRSNASVAAGHSSAISGAAKNLATDLPTVSQTQNNNPESSLIGCYSSLRSAIIALAGALAADADNIEAVGEAISHMDDRLGRGLFG